MSLINDALKKAQNRHGDTTPPPSGATGPASIPSAPRKGKTPVGKIALICVGIALLSAAISTTVILLVVRKDEPAPLPAPPVATLPQPTQPAPLASPVSAPTTAPVTAVPATSSPITSTEASSPTTAPVVSAPPVAVTLPAPTPPEPAPAIKLGTRIQSFIDRLRVTSIRISDTGNKAILNDRLFRINDLVEPSLGLRLTDIQPSQLTFTDESGATYLRHF
ncbi:hypothetical protein CMV30_00120 [Nibricoccus aquaticus]|uniref:Uncharacterized protein n=1 Tax=Nibricoccus aquaticus TaxID=2576891 RepID=A0A290Q1H5_9BACT|nr:hypothetical protein [Nibricoccus aquaticus]ATC62505.1 hypothetical protein CMV30_00120 [Nibricoccus aquaticus]